MAGTIECSTVVLPCKTTLNGAEPWLKCGMWWQVACGGASSFACMVGDQLCSWGKLKVSGDSQMYPKVFMELSGWKIRHMACGATTYACAAHAEGEKSVITWCGPNPIQIPRSQLLTRHFNIQQIMAMRGQDGAVALHERLSMLQSDSQQKISCILQSKQARCQASMHSVGAKPNTRNWDMDLMARSLQPTLKNAMR